METMYLGVLRTVCACSSNGGTLVVFVDGSDVSLWEILMIVFIRD